MDREKFARFSLYCLYFAYGLTITIMAPLVNDIIAEFSLTGAQAGLISTINFVGGVVAIIMLLFVTAKIRKGYLFVAGAGILAVFMYFTGFAYEYVPLLVIMFVLGFGMKTVDTLGTAVLADRITEKADRRISFLHMCFAIGAFISPIVAAWLNDFGNIGWRNVYILFGVIVSAALVLYLVYWRDWGKKDASAGRDDRAGKTEVLKNSDLWVMFAMLFLYCFHQSGITFWSATYFNSQNVPQFVSDFSSSALWVGIIISRIIVAVCRKDIGIPHAVWGSLAGGMLVTSAILVNNPYFLLVSYVVAGIGCGAMIPAFLVKMNIQFPKFTGLVSTILTLGFVAGSSATTVIMGGIADIAGMQVSMLIGAGIPLLVSFAVGIIQFRKRAFIK